MALEIERKFLVKHELWAAVRTPGVPYRQGYLSVQQGRVVRVRVAGDNAYLTVKGLTEGFVRPEFEYPIPLADANLMLDSLCLRPLIEKTRHDIHHEGRDWVVDEFLGGNTGLIVAEVELPASDANVVLPDWIGEEVSHDPRYFNSNLSVKPFQTWQTV